jgi:small subunit ribosomal protein S16
MATKIRLQRHGHKNYAYYHVVIADSRAPRDGKFIERIGSYNPNTEPATIEINFEKALKWVQTGAQPTDTVRNILSDEGVYMMKHLLGGVTKGAFDEAEAQKRFETWKTAKVDSVLSVKTKLTAKEEADKKNRFQAEVDKNKEKAAAIAAKRAKELEASLRKSAPETEEVAAEETEEEVENLVVTDAPTFEDAPEAVVETVEEVAEVPAEEVVEEAPVAVEAVEEITAEVEEAPVAEEAAEEVKPEA